MTQTALKTKLGKRLKHLFTTIPSDSDIVWDLCCDHGALGRAILETRQNTHVIFNDIHPDIMLRLSEQLVQLNASNYELAVSPAEKITLKKAVNQTVVLAGIGDEQCITILNSLALQEPAKHCRFIISPTTKVALVRQFLITRHFYLLEESVVTENNRTYEVLTVCLSNQSNSIKMTSELGDDVGRGWRKKPEHIRHLNKLIGYYQGQALNKNKPYAKNLLDQYEFILKNLTTPLEEK